MKVNQIVYGLTGPAADKLVRLRAARGEVSLRACDLLTSLAILTHDKDTDVVREAKLKLSKIDSNTILKGIAEKVEAPVLREIAMIQTGNEAVMMEIVLSPIVDDTALIFVARKGTARSAELVASLKDRIAKNPAIAAALKQNPAYAPKEAAPPPPPPPPPTPPPPVPSENSPEGTEAEGETSYEGRTLTKEEEEKILADAEKVQVDATFTKEHGNEEEKPMHTAQYISTLSVSGKVKLGNMGNKEVRTLLVKSPNKLIYTAVLNNPRITEEEVLQLTTTKGTPEGVLRLIAKKKEWLENTAIKKSLITNPKTPVEISSRFINSLDTKEVEKIAKSKGIPNVLAMNAKKLLIARKEKK